MNQDELKPEVDTTQNHQPKKRMNQKLFLVFVLLAGMPVIFAILSRIVNFTLSSTQGGSYSSDTTLEGFAWAVVIGQVLFVVSVVGVVAGVIYLIGREKKWWHVALLLATPAILIVMAVVMVVQGQIAQQANLEGYSEMKIAQRDYDDTCVRLRDIRDTTVEQSRFWRRDVSGEIIEQYSEDIAELELREGNIRSEASGLYDSICEGRDELTTEESAKIWDFLKDERLSVDENYSSIKKVVIDAETLRGLREKLEAESRGDISGALALSPDKIKTYDYGCVYPEGNTPEENRSIGCSLRWTSSFLRDEKTTEEMIALVEEGLGRVDNPY